MLVVNETIQIPLDEFEISFARSGGPGGQNVNKVSSKVFLSWAVSASPSLPYGVRQRFIEAYANKINKEGALVLYSQSSRDQSRNRENCLNRLKEMIAAVAVPPVPRVATKPSKAVKKRRVEAKRKLSETKEGRRSTRTSRYSQSDD